MAEKYTDDQSRRVGAEDGAQVYPEPKKGLPVWLWPLLALLLLGLLFALLRHHGSEEITAREATQLPAQTAQNTPAAPPAPAAAAPDVAPANAAPAAGDAAGTSHDVKVNKGTDIATAKPDQASDKGEPLSDVVAFATAADPLTLVGRKAKLTDVPIQKVISDRAFFVGAGPQQQMLVLLDKGITNGPDAAKAAAIRAGQTVSLTGIIEKLPTQEAVNQTYGVGGPDYAAIQGQKAYLHATVAQQK